MIYFNRYISLGNACRTRYQIDRIFGKRDPAYRPTKGFFDWLWGPEMKGVIRALRNDLKISPSDLVVEHVANVLQVRDLSTGFYFLHDFHFSDRAVLNISVAHEEMCAQKEAFLQKYNYLAEKTRAAAVGADSVCYVYHGALAPEVAQEFFLAMREVFNRRPVLLNIVPEHCGHLDSLALEDCDGLWLVRRVDDRAARGSSNEWKGVDASWDLAFEDFGLEERQ